MSYESFQPYNAENTRGLSVRGEAEAGERQFIRHLVTPDFFETMGIPILDGRDFLSTDDRSVYIVDELFASRYLGLDRAVGAEIHADVQPPAPGSEWSRVVGVSGRANVRGLEERDGLPVAYTFLNDQAGSRAYTVLVRTAREPRALFRDMRAKVREVDPRFALYRLEGLQSALDSMLVRRQGITLLATGFAVLALLLAAVGVYGVLAYDVQSRRREIGVRAALGATATQTLLSVVARRATKTAVGLAAGLPCALLAGHLIERHLFDTTAFDAASYLGSAVALFGLVCAAGYFPARRAAGMHPVECLRTD